MSRTDLLKAAAVQKGYFRIQQAIAAGWTRRALNCAASTGEIEKIRYGLYRFAHFPSTPNDELHELQTIAAAGTFSHETALTLFGLSDLLPRTTHFTVPPGSGIKPRPGVTNPPPGARGRGAGPARRPLAHLGPAHPPRRGPIRGRPGSAPRCGPRGP